MGKIKFSLFSHPKIFVWLSSSTTVQQKRGINLPLNSKTAASWCHIYVLVKKKICQYEPHDMTSHLIKAALLYVVTFTVYKFLCPGSLSASKVPRVFVALPLVFMSKIFDFIALWQPFIDMDKSSNLKKRAKQFNWASIIKIRQRVKQGEAPQRQEAERTKIRAEAARIFAPLLVVKSGGCRPSAQCTPLHRELRVLRQFLFWPWSPEYLLGKASSYAFFLYIARQVLHSTMEGFLASWKFVTL
jgi:uncharacterized Zn-finger protein